MGGAVQPKLAVGGPDDRYEREADRVTDRILRHETPPGAGPEVTAAHEPEARTEPSSATDGGTRVSGDGFEARLARHTGHGTTLPEGVRGFFEARLDRNLGGVRVHADAEAARLSRAIGAKAFTHGRDVYFGRGEYDPRSTAGRRLLAHELTHVLQQSGFPPVNAPGPTRSGTGDVPDVQRVVELRPVPRNEDAWDRREELIDRLNALSTALEYRLDGRVLRYEERDPAALTEFDRQMRAFVDRPEVAPMRLVTSGGLVGGQAVLQDFFDLGYVDIDDMLANDDTSLQLNVLHVLGERFAVRNYARRIGTPISDATFQRAHAAGLDAETEFLRGLFGDPSIRFVYEEQRPGTGTLVFGFRSRDENYWVFHVFRGAGRRERGGVVFVQTADGQRATVEEFLAGRAAAPVPP